MAVDTRGLRNELRAYAAQVHLRAAQSMLDEARRAAPVKTGETRISGRLGNRRVTSDGFGLTASFTTPQAKWTDEGTRPHMIVPRRAKVLRFRVGGKVVFARRVNHPGSRKHKGWFTTIFRESHWRAALRRSAR